MINAVLGIRWVFAGRLLGVCDLKLTSHTEQSRARLARDLIEFLASALDDGVLQTRMASQFDTCVHPLPLAASKRFALINTIHPSVILHLCLSHSFINYFRDMPF